MSRSSNGRSSIYLGADGQWHGWVTVGIRPDGAADRRHRMAPTRAELTVKVRELERLRDAGQLRALGPTPTVAEWLRVWLETIAPRTASRSTIETVYRPRIERWIIPRIGGHRLDRVRPEHLDALYLDLAASGLSSKSVPPCAERTRIRRRDRVRHLRFAGRHKPAGGAGPPRPTDAR